MRITTHEKISFLEGITSAALSKDGVNINIWCPFCRHDSKNKLKLAIHLENNIYHCWICDKKGSNIPYLISKINKTAFERSKKIFGVKSKKNDFFDINSRFSLEENEESLEDIKESINDFPTDFKLLAENFNSRHPDTKSVFKYAIKRGFNKHKLWMLKVGFSHHNDFKRSIIIPSLDSEGKLNFYTSRKIDVDSSSGFKYKNAQIQKKNIIFNELNIDWNIPLTIVEGPLDLVKTNDNSTCLLGSTLTEDMLLFEKIIKNKTTVNLALDSDVYYKSLNIARLLDSYGVKVKILDTRIAEDVGDMSHNEFEKCLNDAADYNENSRLLAKISLL